MARGKGRRDRGNRLEGGKQARAERGGQSVTEEVIDNRDTAEKRRAVVQETLVR